MTWFWVYCCHLRVSMNWRKMQVFSRKDSQTGSDILPAVVLFGDFETAGGSFLSGEI